MTPSRTQLPWKNPTEQTDVRLIKWKACERLALQEFKWCVFVLRVIPEDAFQKGDDFEKT